jgi:hypothetical protein
MRITDNVWFQDVHTSIERSILPVSLDLHQYDLLDTSFNNKDVFDILTHHVLKDICEEIVCGLQQGIKSFLYINKSYRVCNSDYILNTPDRVRAVSRLEKLILRVVPAVVITKPYSEQKYYEKLNNNEAEVVSEFERLQHKQYKNAFKTFNFNKIIKYLDSRGLKYLSTDYFQQANKKLLAANK